MKDINTKLLRSFLSVAAERSFSKAASRLACSQATMSQRIRLLESYLEVTLFERSYHDVALTIMGIELLPHAQIIIDNHDCLLDKINKGNVAGSVRLGIAEDYILPILPSVLQRLRHIYPDIELSVVSSLSGSLCQQIEARSLDLALVSLPVVHPKSSVLANPVLCWVASPTFCIPKDSALPLALFPEGCVFRVEAIACLKKNEIPFREAFVSANGQVIRSAVITEAAITVMAAGTIPPELKEIPPEAGLPCLPTICIQIIERNEGLSNAALRVKELITNGLGAN